MLLYKNTHSTRLQKHDINAASLCGHLICIFRPRALHSIEEQTSLDAALLCTATGGAKIEFLYALRLNSQSCLKQKANNGLRIWHVLFLALSPQLVLMRLRPGAT